MIRTYFEIGQWFNSPYSYLDQKFLEYGDTFHLDLPGMKGTLLTSKPDFIDSISKNQNLIGGIGSKFLHHLVGPSVITQFGEEHFQTRKKLNPYFFQNIDTNLIQQLSVLNTHRYLEKLEVNQEFSIADWANNITLRTIIDYLLDNIPQEEKEELFFLVSEWKNTLSLSAYFFLKPMQLNISHRFGWGKFIAHRNLVHEKILSLIQLKAKNNGLLSKMIYEFNWNTSQILHEFVSILMFGHDTSAILVAWWVRHLLTYDLWDQGLSIAQIESSLKEAARITPPVVHLTRVATEDTYVGKTLIKRNQKVFPCIYLSHMNSDYFPNPKKFILDRFQNKSFGSHIYYPFGFGDRICLGKKFAEIQTLEIAAILLKNRKLKLVDPQVNPKRHFFLMVPEHGTKVKIV